MKRIETKLIGGDWLFVKYDTNIQVIIPPRYNNSNENPIKTWDMEKADKLAEKILNNRMITCPGPDCSNWGSFHCEFCEIKN